LKKFFWLMLIYAAVGSVMASEKIFTVSETGEGVFSIQYRGKELLKNIHVLIRDDNAPVAMQKSKQILPDGTTVWNLWNEEYETRFRWEIVESADGSQLEISLLGEAPAYPVHANRRLIMEMDYSIFKDMPYKGVFSHSRHKHNIVSGVFNNQLPEGYMHNQVWRFLAVDGGKSNQLIFDFDPFGPTNPSPFYPCGVINGCWDIEKRNGKLIFSGGYRLKHDGGLTGAKLILKEGVFNDFHKRHVLPHFNYNAHIKPLTIDSFGAVKTGKFYNHWDLKKFDPQAKRGWTAGKNLRVVQGPEGAVYSNVAGKDGAFLYQTPGGGLFLFNFYIGNNNNVKNHFSLSVNGHEYLKDFTVPAGKIAMVNIPIFLKGNEARFEFKGDFLISTMSCQYIISDLEDFSFNRAFWYTEGYEPASAFHSKDYQRPLKLNAAVKMLPLVEVGKETAVPLKAIPRPVELPDRNVPELAWMNDVKMQMLGTTRSTLNEYRDPARMQRFLDDAKKRGSNVFMVSGMHGRHGFPGRLDAHAESLTDLVKQIHAEGFKVLDHHDSTYMENWEQGIRVMAERIGELAVNVSDMAPTPQFCLSNKDFTRTYRQYLRKLLASGVDGFQIDELYYYQHGCLCFSCREAFTRDTNWHLPFNELDERLYNKKSELFRLWFTWKLANIGNWWVSFRREVKDIAPNMVLSLYGCHWEMLKSLPSLNLTIDLVEQARGINMYGTEVMPRNSYSNARSLLPYRKLYNMLCIGYNAPPIWNWFYSSNWEVGYFTWAVSNMLCQSAMLEDNSVRPATSADYNAFAGSGENQEINQVDHLAKTAFYYHASSRDYNTGISYEREFGGLCQIFENCNIPYDIIEHRALYDAKILQRYKVLMVSAASCLSDKDVKIIKDFIRKGGIVYLSSVAGVNDHFGKTRKEWAFKEIFGFEPYPHGFKLANINLPGKDPLTLDHKLSEYYDYYRLQGKVSGDVLLEGTTSEGKKVPLLIGKSYGNGKCYYLASYLAAGFFAGEVQKENTWRFQLDHKVEALLTNLLNKIAAPGSAWQVNAPRLVYTELYRRKSGKGYVAHFLNGTGTELAYGDKVTSAPKGDAWPAIKSDITFVLPDGNIKSAYAVSPDFSGRLDLPLERKKDLTTVTLKKELLKSYTVVFLNK